MNIKTMFLILILPRVMSLVSFLIQEKFIIFQDKRHFCSRAETGLPSNQGILWKSANLIQSGKIRGKRIIFQASGKVKEVLSCFIISLQRGGIQLSVIAAKCYHFMFYAFLMKWGSVFVMTPINWMPKRRLKALQNPIFFQSNDEIVIEGC